MLLTMAVIGLRLSATTPAAAVQSATTAKIYTYGANVTVEPQNCSNLTGTLTIVLMSPFNGSVGFESNAAAATLAIRQAQFDGLIPCWRIK